jgi:hypothetical protein
MLRSEATRLISSLEQSHERFIPTDVTGWISLNPLLVAKRSVATNKYLIADFAEKHGIPTRTCSVRSVVEVLN